MSLRVVNITVAKSVNQKSKPSPQTINIVKQTLVKGRAMSGSAGVKLRDGTAYIRNRNEILPIPGQENILVTSALPYVNNVPHLGNIIGAVLSADVFSRYSKQRGRNTIYICGTDEYGTATETKALAEKVSPAELCAKYHKLHAEIYEWFEIDFDIFGRTTTPLQTEIAQDIFVKLSKNGYLEQKETTQLYCESHSSFLADRFVEGECPKCQYPEAKGDQCDKCGSLLDPLELINPRCKVDNATPVIRNTTHMYLKLNELQSEVDEWFQKASKEGRWSDNSIQITQNWIKTGLEPRAITRDLKWGTPIPEGFPDLAEKVLYVWFDACIGYVSITAKYTKEWKKWWKEPENVKLYQFMGKDNVPFHTVIFPSSQLGTKEKWTKLHHLSTTEYLTYENDKFSKSKGVGVFGNNAQETGIPPSVWRYVLLSQRPETKDSAFQWDDLVNRNNAELLNNLGNMINRVTKFTKTFYGGIVPEYEVSDQVKSENKQNDFIDEINKLLSQYNDAMEAVELRRGLTTILEISSVGNGFLQSNVLGKDLLENSPERCSNLIGLVINLAYLIGTILQPFIPSTSNSIMKQLNAPLRLIPNKFELEILPGHELGEPEHLFTRMTKESALQFRAKYGPFDEPVEKKSKKQAKKEKKEQDKARVKEPAVAELEKKVEHIKLE